MDRWRSRLNLCIVVFGIYGTLGVMAFRGGMIGFTDGGLRVSGDWEDTNNPVVRFDFETINDDGTVDGIAGLTATSMPNVATGPSRIVAGTNSFGRVEHCYDFDGSDDYFAIEDDATMDTASFSNTTHMVWVLNTNALSHNQIRGIAHHIGSDSSEVSVYLQGITGNPTKYESVIRDTGAVHTILGTIKDARSEDGTWHQMGAVRDGTDMRLYVDGAQVYHWTFTPAMSTLDLSGGVLGMIGNMTGYNMHWGQLDDYRIYDHTLTPAALTNIFLNTHPTNNVEIR